MKPRVPFSCVIFGEGSLPIRCAEVLASRGHRIKGIVTAEEAIRRWAATYATPLAAPTDDIAELIGREPFDYLFSIVNPRVLPRELLELPTRYAINYHDALLPGYAGSHATTWAILGREKRHGITWHVMSEVVDGGDILRQCSVDVEDGETALTLNAKCYDAAAHSFSALIDDLESGREHRQQQDQTARTFFRHFARPAEGCVFSWSRTAGDLDALRRALDFGPYPNPIGLPKILLGGDFIIVGSTTVREGVPSAKPGTITGIEDELLRVSTSSGELAIGQLKTIDGQPLSVSDVVARYALSEGFQCSELDVTTARRLTELNAALGRHEAFWVERLADLQPLALPYARNHASPLGSGRCTSVFVAMPPEVVRYLEHHRTVSRASDGLLAAFAIYLARLGQVHAVDVRYRDVALRHLVDGLDGFFAAHIPLRLKMDGAQDFTSACRSVGEALGSVRQHESYARDVVMRQRVLGSQPHLQSAESLSIAVECVARLDESEQTPGCALTMVVTEDGTACRWIHDPEVFDSDAVSNMLGQFSALLQGLVANPNQRVSALPFVTAAERRQLLVAWNATARDYATDDALHTLVEAQVARTPDACAVVCAERTLTYGELNDRANAVAAQLVARGVGRGAFVPMLMERSLEVAIAMLAVMKTGAAFVPVDVAWPAARIVQVFAELGSAAVLVNGTTPLPPTALETAFFVVDARADQRPATGSAAPNLAIRVDSADPLYAIYTSGSTGTPKAAVVPHAGITNRFAWMTEFFGRDAAAAVLQTTSHLYDSAVWQLFWPLINGGATIMPAPGTDANAEELAILIDMHHVTLTDFVPSVLSAIVPQLVADPASQHQLRSLRSVIVGGEAIAAAATYAFMAQFPAVRVVNLYGPTEASIGCICYEIKGREDGAIPIGRPIANVQVAILDPHRQLVPVGVPGELYLTGRCLGLGYLHDAAKTAAAFVDLAFAECEHQRWYRTGDLVRYRADGNIEFLGRVDHQVKIRGLRIELGEIETALATLPGVRDAVVLAREDVPGEKRLVAYVVPAGPSAPAPRELRALLQPTLPAHLIPADFVLLDILPLTPNGKVDRRALPAPEADRPNLVDAYAAPRTPTEATLADIWMEVLGVPRVGVHDNFFELGGHSLSATRVVSRVRTRCGVELTLRSVFDSPTISALAEAIEQL